MKFTPRQLWYGAGGLLTALVLVASAADAWPKVVSIFPWVTGTELTLILDARSKIRDEKIADTIRPLRESIDTIILEQQKQGAQIREMGADRVNDRVSNLEVQVNQLQTSLITIEDALKKDPVSAFLRRLKAETESKISDLNRKYTAAECERLNLLRVAPRPC